MRGAGTRRPRGRRRARCARRPSFDHPCEPEELGVEAQVGGAEAREVHGDPGARARQLEADHRPSIHVGAHRSDGEDRARGEHPHDGRDLRPEPRRDVHQAHALALTLCSELRRALVRVVDRSHRASSETTRSSEPLEHLCRDALGLREAGPSEHEDSRAVCPGGPPALVADDAVEELELELHGDAGLVGRRGRPHEQDAREDHGCKGPSTPHARTRSHGRVRRSRAGWSACRDREGTDERGRSRGRGRAEAGEGAIVLDAEADDHVVVLGGREEEATRRVDREAPRPPCSEQRVTSEHDPVVVLDREDGDRVVAAVGHVDEPLAVAERDLRHRVAAVELGGERALDLEGADGTARVVEREHLHARVALVREVDVVAAAGDDEVARARALVGGVDARGRQRSGRGVEGEHGHVIGSETGHERPAVRRCRQDLVGVGARRLAVDRITERAVCSEGVRPDGPTPIVRHERISARAIDRHVRGPRAARASSRTDLADRARSRREREADDLGGVLENRGAPRTGRVHRDE